MTVAVQVPTISYSGTGSAAPLAVPFQFLNAAHLRVTRVTAATGAEAVLALGVDYIVAGVGQVSGGSVTPLAAIASGTSWRIERVTPIEQPAVYEEDGDFRPKSHERALDRLALIAQEVTRDLAGVDSRTVKVPVGEAAVVLPPLASRRGWLAQFNSVTGGLEAAPYNYSDLQSLSGSAATNAGLAQYWAQQALAAGSGNFSLVAVDAAQNMAALGLVAGAAASAGAANRTALNSGSVTAIAANRNLFLPGGTWEIVANNGTSTGWNINPGVNGTVMLRGEPGRTLVRREPTATRGAQSADGIPPYSADCVIWPRGDGGATFILSGLTLDGGNGNFPENTGVVYDGQGANGAYEYNRSEWFVTCEESSDGGATYTRLLFTEWYVEQRVSFTSGGTYVPQVNDNLVGATSGKQGLVKTVTLTSGSWAGGDAAGWIDIALNGDSAFTAGEAITIGANLDVMTVAGPPVRWVRVIADKTGKKIRLRDNWTNEQSATIRNLSGSGSGVMKRTVLTDLTFRGRVGDDYKMATPSEYLNIRGWFSEDDPKIARGSLQMSSPARICGHITDYIATSLESEPGGLVGTEYLGITQAFIRGQFDIAGGIELATGRRFGFYGANIRHLGDAAAHPFSVFNFYRVEGRVTTSLMSRPNRLQESDAVFSNCEWRITCPNDPRLLDQIATVNLVYTVSFAGAKRSEFHGVRFTQWNTTATPITKGAMFAIQGVQTDRNVRSEWIDCNTFGFTGEYFVQMSRSGFVRLKGGALTGSKAVVDFNNASPGYMELVIEQPTEWTGNLLAISNAVNGTAIIRIDGIIDENLCQPIWNTSPITHGTTIDWQVRLQVMVNSDPNGRIRGIPGARCRLKDQIAGVIREWVYAPSAVGRCSETVWQAVPATLTGTKTHDWASLATGSVQSTTVTVTGAALGDTVEVSMSVALSGTRLWGEVTSANTVTVYHRNDTGGTVDVASGTLRACVRRWA